MPEISREQAEEILAENFADWVRDLDLTIEQTSPDALEMRIKFSEKLCRIGGIMCGQALISGADTAMVIALASASGGMRPMTTVDLTCNYMRPIIDEDAILNAKVKRLGKSLAFCTTDVAGSVSNKQAAFATGTYAILG